MSSGNLHGWIWLACLLLAGCFTTRPVEPPDVGNSDWVSPTDYRILLTNFQNAVGQRNPQNYLRCFNEARFEFQPAVSVAGDNQALWEQWSLVDEQAYLENLIQDLDGGISLELTETDLQTFSGDSVRYVGSYNLLANHQDTSVSKRLVGQLQFTMGLNAFNEWSILRWIDLETTPDSSWSVLKLGFAQ